MQQTIQNHTYIQKIKDTQTYIPILSDRMEQHDLFIDLLSYKNNLNDKNDIWDYDYI